MGIANATRLLLEAAEGPNNKHSLNVTIRNYCMDQGTCMCMCVYMHVFMCVCVLRLVCQILPCYLIPDTYII